MKLVTPIRYPGGKSKAIKKIVPFIPSSFEEYREPFLGGASVAIYITQHYPDAKIWVNDLYSPLINFWQKLQQDSDALTQILYDLKKAFNSPDDIKYLYKQSKDNLHDLNHSPLSQAVAFYIINRCSFSGSTESGGFSIQAAMNRFTLSGIEKLPHYSKLIQPWKITNLSYEQLLHDYNDQTFIYLDPPYEINQSLYGRNGSLHDRFNHDEFAANVSRIDCRTLISYNSNQIIKDRFNQWAAVEYDHPYSMVSTETYRQDQHKRKELLLFNYNPPANPLISLSNKNLDTPLVL